MSGFRTVPKMYPWRLAVFALVSCSLASFATSDEDMEDFYEKVFEEIDPDLILDNERLLNSYLKCFFNEGPCSEHAQFVKEAIPETMETVCGACSDKQKEIMKYSLNKFIPSHPNEWKKFLGIYDPDGKYWPNIKAFIES